MIKKPWTRKDMPFHWRRQMLDMESQEYAKQFISYKKGKYGPSLVVASNERTKFYNNHENELFN